jgi:glutathione S-transferase
MKLYGTTTSPFVRRVRVVAREAGVAYERIDTATPDGKAALERVSPIWKVPVAEIDGRTIFDSRAIIEWLTTTRGWGGLAVARDRFTSANQLNAIDAAIESGVQLFYLRRDGVQTEGLPVAERQVARIASILDWLGGELTAGRLGGELGLAEVSLLCALDWMDFRAVHPATPLRNGAALGRLREAHRERPSLAATRPQT